MWFRESIMVGPHAQYIQRIQSTEMASDLRN